MSSLSIIYVGAFFGSAVFVFAIAMWAIRGIGRFEEIYDEAKDTLFEELDAMWELDLLKSLEDVLSTRRRVAKVKKSSRLESAEIIDLLDEYFTNITSEAEINKQKLLFVKELADRQMEEEPFSILPDKERAVASTLKKSIEAGDKVDSLRQLEELVNSIGSLLNSAKEEVNKIRMWTKASVFLAVGTVGLTIFLSLLFRQPAFWG